MVAVTGTVFSVNSGTKGSRVTVIEGEVHVEHAGLKSILHSGDQVATTQSVGLVPVREEIAWSSDLDHELALLAEFSKLRVKLQEIQTPGPRYESKILPLLPADTVLYIGIPNLGAALQEANQNLPATPLAEQSSARLVEQERQRESASYATGVDRPNSLYKPVFGRRSGDYGQRKLRLLRARPRPASRSAAAWTQGLFAESPC